MPTQSSLAPTAHWRIKSRFPTHPPLCIFSSHFRALCPSPWDPRKNTPCRYVRPGGGFIPNFQLFEKGDVNGEKEQKFYTFLKVSTRPALEKPLHPAGAASGRGCSCSLLQPASDRVCATLCSWTLGSCLGIFCSDQRALQIPGSHQPLGQVGPRRDKLRVSHNLLEPKLLLGCRFPTLQLALLSQAIFFPPRSLGRGRDERVGGALSRADASLVPLPERLSSYFGAPGLTGPPILGTHEGP